MFEIRTQTNKEYCFPLAAFDSKERAIDLAEELLNGNKIVRDNLYILNTDTQQVIW